MLRHLMFIAATIFLLSSCGKNSGENGAKKVFRYNQTGGLKSLDPAFAGDRATVWATSQIFNGLFDLDENLHPHPALAETWDISPDELTYTFKIRKGVLFQDNDCFPGGKGRELVAEDFVYSFKRILRPGTGSTGAWIFRNCVLTKSDGSAHDSAFVALNDHTLQIRLKRKFPPFKEILTMPYAFVIPEEAITKYGKDFRSNPVGTGPFMLKDWSEGESLTMEKNDNYWKKDPSGNKLPYIDAVIVKFIEDPNQAFREFEAGNLDFITGLPENAKELLGNKGQIKEEYRKKYNVEKIPYMNTEYIGFQLSSENYKDTTHPFLNANFRKALNYAIDRDELIFSLRNGLGTPGVSGVTPVALPSFDSLRVQGYSYDQKKALEMLKQAGFPGGAGLPEITLHTYPSDKAIAEFIQKQWEAIGVKVGIEQNQFVTHKDMVDNGKVNLFRGSWLGDYPDAENYFAMFYSDNLSPAGPNKTHYINPDFDALYNEAQEKDDHSENHFLLYDYYHKMDQLIMNDAPVVVLFYDDILRVYNKEVTGLKTNNTNILMLETVDFKEAE
ncbi:MAG: ABC transporter substrate-binding protein [Thermonemataceae bacterium]